MIILDKIKEDATILRTVYLLSFRRVSNILPWLSTESSNSIPFNQGFRHDSLRYKLKSYGISGCMGSLRKSIQLMLEFLKAPFLLLHFSY